MKTIKKLMKTYRIMIVRAASCAPGGSPSSTSERDSARKTGSESAQATGKGRPREAPRPLRREAHGIRPAMHRSGRPNGDFGSHWRSSPGRARGCIRGMAGQRARPGIRMDRSAGAEAGLYADAVRSSDQRRRGGRGEGTEQRSGIDRPESGEPSASGSPRSRTRDPMIGHGYGAKIGFLDDPSDSSPGVQI